jgi:D,D-heptose 1,7-bisphosphate phosphatase
MNKAFFLDRDGTVNIDYNFVHKPEEWDWCAGAIEALHWMTKHNFKIIVVTNQSGIARGQYTEREVQELHNWVDEKLKKEGVTIHDWFYAAHHPKYDPTKKFPPDDRKPGTGMFEKAAAKHDINFSQSYMAGDKITDLKPAVTLGITPFFIRSRHETNHDKSSLDRYNIPIFENINEVVDTHSTQIRKL